MKFQPPTVQGTIANQAEELARLTANLERCQAECRVWKRKADELERSITRMKVSGRRMFPAHRSMNEVSGRGRPLPKPNTASSASALKVQPPIISATNVSQINISYDFCRQ